MQIEIYEIGNIILDKSSTNNMYSINSNRNYKIEVNGSNVILKYNKPFKLELIDDVEDKIKAEILKVSNYFKSKGGFVLDFKNATIDSYILSKTVKLDNELNMNKMIETIDLISLTNNYGSSIEHYDYKEKRYLDKIDKFVNKRLEGICYSFILDEDRCWSNINFGLIKDSSGIEVVDTYQIDFRRDSITVRVSKSTTFNKFKVFEVELDDFIRNFQNEISSNVINKFNIYKCMDDNLKLFEKEIIEKIKKKSDYDSYIHFINYSLLSYRYSDINIYTVKQVDDVLKKHLTPYMYKKILNSEYLDLKEDNNTLDLLIELFT